MPIHLALLLSLVLHVGLIVAPSWLLGRQERPPEPTIEARLIPQSAAPALAQAVSTESERADSVAPTPATRPTALQGGALRRAQSALSEHLFYPPEAVARGLEGEVVLLLVLGDNGRLVSATIARSSGHALLDQAALDAAQHLGALPGNPRETLFPVSFRLR